MQVRKFQVSVTGTTPIAFNNPASAPSKKENIKDHEKWEEDHWMERLYRNTDNKIIVPSKALKKMSESVCSLLDIKPSVGALKSYTGLVKKCWIVMGEGPILEFDEKQLTQWRERVNPNPNTRKGGGGVMKIRPRVLAPWKIAFTLQTIHDCFTKAVVEEILGDAFSICGLGEGRDFCGYGRGDATVLEI